MIQLTIDKELIDRCRARDARAQESLYRLCYPVFMKICLRYASGYDDAANILQESFIKIFMKLHSYQESGDVVGWMKRIVVNSAIDHVRKEKTRSTVSMAKAIDVKEEEVAEENFVIDENQLLALIRELPETQSLVFNLFVMENYSHQEIAERLDMTVASSKWYLFDARKILQKRISVYVNERR